MVKWVLLKNRGTIQSFSEFTLFVTSYGNSTVESVANTGSMQSDNSDGMKVYARENSSVGAVTNSGDIQADYWGIGGLNKR